LSISAGCALYPDDATDAESLLEKADERMYEEKRRRKFAQSQVQLASSAQIIVFPKAAPKVFDGERPTTVASTKAHQA
jgi:predicted signal transduction protein with EAL and GGDEF domain